MCAPQFRDATADLGLTLAGEGACWVDIDADGDPDLCAGGSVWRNDDGKTFVKLADVGAVVAGDMDNDGFPDLYSWNQRKLYRNIQGKSFEEVALPELPQGASRGACWGDFDNDGRLDLYVGGFEDWNNGLTYANFVLHNTGAGFTVAQVRADHRSRGITACDFDQDGDLDVYVSNYRLQPNNLLVNDKGAFVDQAGQFNAVATSAGFEGGHSIGAAWGDFDNDGKIDLFAGNFAHVDSRGDQPKSRFLRNSGSAGGFKFQDLGPCGVWYQESYASPAAGDFDNDGHLDLFFTTVYANASFGKKNFPVMYRNEGGFKFADVTAGSGLEELGPTYQAAWADFDGDGDLDLVSSGRFFINQSSGHNWLQVRLEGDGKTVNRSAIGAQVRVRGKGAIWTRQVEAGTGEGNQSDLTLHFGLGEATGPVDLVVDWPGGKKELVKGVKLNACRTIKFGS